jgi:small-conductance mechanosensitive channel
MLVNDILRESVPVPQFSNSVLDWVVALGIAIAWLIALLTIRHLIRRYHRRFAETPNVGMVEVLTATLGRTTLLFILIIAAEAGLATLNPSGLVTRVARTAVMISLIWQVGVWSTAATGALLERRRVQALDTDLAAAGSLGIVGVLVRTVIWVIVVLLILQNTGVDVSALLAGLGIGGVAVALALQNILGDLFASLSITFDRPFVVGDLLFLDSFAGRVEHIGLKNTRLRSLGGEQIIVSNADLLRSRLRNYGRMSERSVEFTLGIAYDTSAETLERIPELIREIISTQENARFARSHLARHGTYSLDFETMYYVLSPDFTSHMDVQHSIQIRIHREFALAGIQFAGPWRVLVPA